MDTAALPTGRHVGLDAWEAAIAAEDLPGLIARLDPEVVFKSPVVHKAYVGRDQAGFILGGVFQVFRDFRYVDAILDGDKGCLIFGAKVGDRDLEGVDLIEFGPDGLVTDLTVMIRPRSAVMAVTEAMASMLEKMQASGSV